MRFKHNNSYKDSIINQTMNLLSKLPIINIFVSEKGICEAERGLKSDYLRNCTRRLIGRDALHYLINRDNKVVGLYFMTLD